MGRGTHLLLPIHVEGEGERLLAESLSLGLQLLKLALRDTPQLENQAAGGGRLAGVDMAADDNGQMLLLSLRGGGEEGRGASAAAPPLIWVGFGRARARGGRESGGRRWVLHRDTPPRSAHAWGGRSCTLGRWGSVQYSRC